MKLNSNSRRVLLSLAYLETAVNALDLTVIDALRGLYSLRDEREIGTHLRGRDRVRAILPLVRRELAERFGDDNVRLELVDDREFPGKPTLFAVVETRRPAAEAALLLGAFDDEWWLDAAEGVDGQLSVAVDFAA